MSNTPVGAAPVPPSLLQWALRELLGALPERRDWLNPDAEKVLRVAVDNPPVPAPTAAPEQVAEGADERALFEAWVQDSQDVFCLDWKGNDSYDHEKTMAAWGVWQARAALSQPPEAAPLAELREQLAQAILADLTPGRTDKLPIERVTSNAAIMRAAEIVRGQVEPTAKAAQLDGDQKDGA